MTQNSPPTASDPRQLAFETLLGAPLNSFDPGATYALFHWDDLYSADFEWDEDALAQLAAPAAPRSAKEGDDPHAEGLGWGRFMFDMGGSWFSVSELEGDLGDALKAAGVQEWVRGEVFAGLVAAHGGFEALEEDNEELFIPICGRVQTDGSLFDAMAAATWTMGFPKGLVEADEDAEVDPEWEDKLAVIEDDALREHMGMLCQTDEAARCTGAEFIGRDHCPSEFEHLASQPGFTLLAAWGFGEGQASQAVFQIAGKAA